MSNGKNTLGKIKESLKSESKKFSNTAHERTVGYIEGGLGVVAGLAWNEAVRALIEYLVPISKNTILAKFGYALTITLIVVLIATYLTRTLKK